MKIFIFSLLVIAFAYTLGANICDPDSDGEPECTAENVGQAFRNFWDPVHYWVCTDVNAEPESVRCPTGTLFDAAEVDCISWRQWNWTNPCPELAESE